MNKKNWKTRTLAVLSFIGKMLEMIAKIGMAVLKCLQVWKWFKKDEE